MYLADPVFDGVGLAGFKSWANAFLYIGLSCSLFISIFIYHLCAGVSMCGGVAVNGCVDV